MLGLYLRWRCWLCSGSGDRYRLIVLLRAGDRGAVDLAAPQASYWSEYAGRRARYPAYINPVSPEA